MIQAVRPLVYVALDLDDSASALELARRIQRPKLGFKIGPRLALRDSNLVEQLSRLGPVFVDCKFLDIPSTMAAAVRAIHTLGAQSCTVHALAGPEALSALSDLKSQLNSKSVQGSDFQIHVVTLLTSFRAETLPTVLRSSSVSNLVDGLISDVINSGLNSIVCSPEEAAGIRSRHSSHELEIVCPGIRLQGGATHDQSRVATPNAALAAGATSLVIGRTILESVDPESTVDQIFSQLESKA